MPGKSGRMGGFTTSTTSPPDPRGFNTERKSFGGAMVTLTVGSEIHTYFVHEELLCKHAPFFQSAVKEDWKEGRDRTIPLPEDSPDVVSLYLNWVYTSQLLSRDPTDERGSGEIRLLVDAFVFGEKIQDGRFKDAVIDAAIKSTLLPDKEGQTWFPGVADVNRAYKGTPPGSPLRRLIVDLWALNGQQDWDRKELNVDFLTDLTGELFVHRSNWNQDLQPSSGKTSTCSYHQHGDDQSCYSQRSYT